MTVYGEDDVCTDHTSKEGDSHPGRHGRCAFDTRLSLTLVFGYSKSGSYTERRVDLSGIVRFSHCAQSLSGGSCFV